VAALLSQDEEEKLVRKFFGGAETGFFVEVGANHPTKNSQTWHLEQAGWTGVLVEPQPDLAAWLITARTAKVFACACSSPDKAAKSLPLHVSGPMSSLDRTKMAPGAKTQYVLMVPVRTLDDILQEAEAPTPIDFLSIDVEGHELEVLSGFDFARWQPRLILLEDHVGDLEKHRFLKRSGYRLVRRAGFNGWYVPKKSAVRPALRDCWQIIRKYHLALPLRRLRNLSRRLRGKVNA
jgi:FkbM family methyltransferase